MHPVLSPGVEMGMAWSKYHPTANRVDVETPGTSSILPLIKEPVHTLRAQFHCINIIKSTISSINPGQIPVERCDQPVYALTKEIQWRYPNNFSDNQYFAIFGGLHIEKSLLGIHGELIAGSGLAEILEVTDLSTIGVSTASLDVSDINQSRYCMQVSLCAIYHKLKEAHKDRKSFLPVFDWYSNMYVYFMTAGSMRVYNVNALSLSIGVTFCSALSFCYAST